MKLNIKSLLKDKNVLYVVFFIAIINSFKWLPSKELPPTKICVASDLLIFETSSGILSKSNLSGSSRMAKSFIN